MTKEEIKIKLIEIYYKYYGDMPADESVEYWVERMLKIVISGTNNE